MTSACLLAFHSFRLLLRQLKRKVPCHVHLTSRVCFTMLGNFLNCRTVLRCPTHFLLRNPWTRARKRPGYSAEPPERPLACCLRSRVCWFCHRSCAGEELSREHQVSLCRALNKDTFEDRYKLYSHPISLHKDSSWDLEGLVLTGSFASHLTQRVNTSQ